MSGVAEIIVSPQNELRVSTLTSQHMESTSREDLFAQFKPGGAYSDITGVYHEHLSAHLVGQPDSAMMGALPDSCKWLAHKGAGYDSVDVNAAKKRGESFGIK